MLGVVLLCVVIGDVMLGSVGQGKVNICLTNIDAIKKNY